MKPRRHPARGPDAQRVDARAPARRDDRLVADELPEHWREGDVPHDVAEALVVRPKASLRGRFRQFLQVLPGYVVIGLLCWWLWPSGGITLGRLGWIALCILGVPLALYLLFVIGYFWMWHRWVKYRK